jgi:hypothetical protein
LNKNDAYYDLGGSCKVDEDGNLDVTLTAMFTGILPDNWQDYTGEPEIYPDLYIDREHEDFLYKLTLAPNGKIIKKGETATCGGVQIPVEALMLNASANFIIFYFLYMTLNFLFYFSKQ